MGVNTSAYRPCYYPTTKPNIIPYHNPNSSLFLHRSYAIRSRK